MRLKLKRKYLGMSAALSVAMVTAACGGAERTVKIQTQADPLLHLAQSDRDFETETDEAPGFGIKGFLDEFGYNDDGDDERFPLTSFEEARSERDNAVAQEVINCRSEAGVIGGTTADPDGPTSRTNDSESESHGRYHRDGETGDHGRYHRDPIRTAPRNCLSGHLEGRYIDLPNRNGGVFGGRWVTRRGRFVGHVVGRYRASRQGPNTFRGKIIRRNGRYIGRISGTWYGSNGAPTPLPGPMTAPEESEGNSTQAQSQDPTATPVTPPSRRLPPPAMCAPQNIPTPRVDGIFFGRWQLRNGRVGVLSGSYINGNRGHFNGQWTELCEQTAGPVRDVPGPEPVEPPAGSGSSPDRPGGD